MKILIFGSTGFIGRQVVGLLRQQGHDLLLPTSKDVNFLQPNQLDIDKIHQLMQGVNIVINMVGIMSRHPDKLENVHHHTPLILAKIAKQQGVFRWVNLSALGADATSKIAFVGSKGRGDNALLKLIQCDFNVVIARPSIVFGRGGASCELFIKLSLLPILVLPNKGNFQFQPVHVSDVALGLVNLAVMPVVDVTDKIIDFTGDDICSLAEYLTMMAKNIHAKSHLIILSIPLIFVKIVAIFAKYLTDGMVSLDSLQLLANGSVADNQKFYQLLQKAPLSYQQFH